MSQPPSPADPTLSLNAHAAAKGAELRAKYGADLGWEELQQVLKDRALVRYPTAIAFDAGPLLPGELAHPVANGKRPKDGFTMCVHPRFATQPRRVVYAVVYQLVVVNYGEFASADDAETFGAGALGLSKDAYYQALCEMADELSAAECSCPG
jgi:hypothetical protein